MFRELKRRKVLHTLSLYVIGCWVALQVVEVLSDAGLPAGTMRQVLWAMAAIFPLVLVSAWFFDISASGITRTTAVPPGSKRPQVNLGDHALLIGLVAVAAITAYVLSMPVRTDGIAERHERVLAVMPFEDFESTDEFGTVGAAIAGELRDELTRVAGLKVLARETSQIIHLAGEDREKVATDLGVSSILTGDVTLNKGRLELKTSLIGLPAGEILWQTTQQSDIAQGASLQQTIVEAVINAILPTASAQTIPEPRIEIDECGAGYELYLRGKQLWQTQNWQRGLELLEHATQLSPDCAVAWEALATSSLLTWSKADLAKAGNAARRALKLNESLPGAWAVLAEIAEDEQRWGESEELFLRALLFDPTDAFTNMAYGEALLARGRVREALQYVLEAFRYDPASHSVNWKVTLVARYLGNADILLKHANIYRELRAGRRYNGWYELAEGHRLLGDAERALSYWGEGGAYIGDWYPQCVRASLGQDTAEGLPGKIRETLTRYQNGELPFAPYDPRPMQILRCATWIGKPDIAIELLETEDDAPTEAIFMTFFQADSGVLRQTEFFRNKVVDSGLLDYWRKWGWSDYCRPDGDSFVCD